MDGHFADERDYERRDDPGVPEVFGLDSGPYADLSTADFIDLADELEERRKADSCQRCRGIGMRRYRDGWDWCPECDGNPIRPGTRSKALAVELRRRFPDGWGVAVRLEKERRGIPEAIVEITP